MVSKEEENFLRIVYLHYRVATGALTNFFDTKHPSLSADLNIPGNKAILKDLYKPPRGNTRVLYRNQWKTLYPTTGPTKITSAELDLTLIVVILRHLLPVVNSPRKGFDDLPDPNEISDGANIACLKYYKNHLVSHSKDGILSNKAFTDIWNKLEQAITGLDKSQATAESVKDAEKKILDNSMAQMLSTQIQLDAKVSNLEKQLETIFTYIDKDEHEKQKLKQITENLDKRMNINETILKRKAEECKEDRDKLIKQLNTFEVQINETVQGIDENLFALQKFQRCLDSLFTRIKTIVISSEKEKEDSSDDVESLCSRIQVYINKIEEHEERIAVLEIKCKLFPELQRDVNSLKMKLELIDTELKKQDENHIPKNIRDTHDEEIEEWERDQTTFLETRATRHILGLLPSNSCIIVTGSSGCGKSSNIHHAALHLRKSLEYEIIPVLTGPTNIIDYYNKNKKQVFIVDDICGKETINMQTLQTWRDYSKKIEKLFDVAEKDNASKNDKAVLKLSSPKLLMSCGLHIYQEAQFQRISVFTNKECNLSSDEWRLLELERMHMLLKYRPDDIYEKIKLVPYNVDYFPLLCKLSKDKKTSEEVNKLFTAPLKSIKESIKIIIENTFHFCALTLCLIFDDGFNTDWLEKGSVLVNKTHTLEGIVEEFYIDLSKEIPRNSLKSVFSTLNGTYFKQRGNEYRMIHDRIYKMASVVCGQRLRECFIKYAPSVFIRDHFIFESLKTEVSEDNDAIVLMENQEEAYFLRLLYDLKDHDTKSTFYNNQLKNSKFRKKLISFFKSHDDAIAVLKHLDTQGCKKHISLNDINFHSDMIPNKTTPLLEFASSGYLDIVQFLIVDVECNVNKTDGLRWSSLFIASEIGNFALAELLLKYKADVFQDDFHKMTPLHWACVGGHTNTVKLLLDHGAKVSQCDLYSKSSLYIACEGGHTNTVELLLNYSDGDVNQCNQFKISPLSVACGRGHTATAALLLAKNANITKCDIRGESPLYVACKGGYKDTVKLLLQNNADVKICNEQGKSPLYIACEGGHKDTAELLLEHNANVSQSNKWGESPLYAACEGGHTNTVELLLKNNADVSQCDSRGWSPLHAVCSIQRDFPENYLIFHRQGQFPEEKFQTVKILIKWNANVMMRNNEGKTPTDFASESNNIELMNLLSVNLAKFEPNIS